MPSSEASSSIAASSAQTPSITPGARNARGEPMFCRSATTEARTLAQRYRVFIGSRTGGVHPPRPMPTSAVASTAVSVPFAAAPSSTPNCTDAR
jgi:hypothetical protein